MNNPTVIYTNGVKEQFEALRCTKKGVIIGRIIDGEFFSYGFILRSNIKQINNLDEEKNSAISYI